MRKTDPKAQLSFAIGIQALLYAWCCPFINIFFAIAAIILAICSKKDNNDTYCVMSYAGLVCGILAAIVQIPAFLFWTL